METLLVVLLFITVAIVFKAADYCIKSSRRENMYKKVGWIAEKKNPMYHYKNVNLRYNELTYYIMRQQAELSLPKEFCIDFTNEDEKMCVEKILDIHKDYVVKMYFSDFLPDGKLVCKLTQEEYYIYSLYDFLYHNLDERDLRYLGDIYKFKEKDKPYSTYTLTEVGRTSYKIYLIALMFIESHEKTKNLFKYINPNLKAHIMDYLKTNEITFVKL